MLTHTHSSKPPLVGTDPEGRGISSFVSYGFSYCFLIKFAKKSYSPEKKPHLQEDQNYNWMMLVLVPRLMAHNLFPWGFPMVFLWFLEGL